MSDKTNNPIADFLQMLMQEAVSDLVISRIQKATSDTAKTAGKTLEMGIATCNEYRTPQFIMTLVTAAAEIASTIDSAVERICAKLDTTLNYDTATEIAAAVERLVVAEMNNAYDEAVRKARDKFTWKVRPTAKLPYPNRYMFPPNVHLNPPA